MDEKKQKKYLNKCLRVLKGKNSYKIRTFTDLAKAIKTSVKTFRFYNLNNIPEIKEILQKKFNALYEQSKENIPDTQENCSDCRFYYILEKASSKNTSPIQTRVLVLMDYYFSSWDIFEEPQ